MSPQPTGRRRKGRRWKQVFCFLLFFVLFFVHIEFLVTSPALSAAPPRPDDTLLFREGETFFAKGDTEKALWRFKSLVTDFPKSSLYNEAKFRMAVCYTQLKRSKDAVRTLNELFSTFLSPERMVQVLTLLGDNHMELKDALTALQWYGKGLLVQGQPHEELKKKIRAIIDTFNTEEKLSEIESLYKGAYGGGYAKLKLAQLVKARGNEALAKRVLAEWEKEYRTTDYGPLPKDLAVSGPLPEKAKYTLGVVLPLSGLYQPFGEKALQGIQLAIKEIDRPGRPPLISLAVRDSREDPSETERAIEELVRQEKVIAVIGVLLTPTVEKAAKRCQQLKVPLITLSQKEPLGVKGDFIFQNSVTPSTQVETLGAFAIREMELRTFSVFYPNSPYGHHFKTLFAQEVTRRGGKVVGSVAYQEDQIDFSQEIKTLFKIKAPPKTDSTRGKEEEYAPSLSVDALFIPDTADRASQIMMQMDYYNVKGMAYLGTNAWNNPGLLTATRKFAEGAILVDAFSKTNPSSSSELFVKEFQKMYAREPGTLEALSYEGAAVVREILRTKSVSSPLQLKEEIRRIQNFQGVCGLKAFNEDGKMIRTLSILRVNKGQIEHFSP
jgi:branched-chain amino acid transport system substrate-binding protein